MQPMIVGVDEVGRGCWAGPLVAGAVILDKPIRGLKDSKKLTKAEREKFDIRIRQRARAIGLGWVSSVEIDALGMTQAVRLAMQRAMAEIHEPFDRIIIDGNYNFLADMHGSQTLVKADDKIPAVSAASIVAKVARDRWMSTEAASNFPHYEFETHVGYGTPRHRLLIKTHGVCELHRRLFAPIQSRVAETIESI